MEECRNPECSGRHYEKNGGGRAVWQEEDK